VIVDMIIKCLFSTARFTDYAYLGFYNMTIREARSYLNGCRYAKVQRYLRSPEVKKLLNDKVRFLTTFQDFVKRDFFYITDNTKSEEILHFVERHRVFIAKPNSLNGGRGIELVDSKEYPDIQTLIAFLLAKQLVLLEEVVENHSILKKFSQRSLNTIRIIAIRTQDEIKILRAYLKFNLNDGVTDNISAGGYACPIDTETGKLIKGMTNSSSLLNVYLPYHPEGFAFEGEQIPFWTETVDLVAQVMLALKEAFFVAWDIAVTEDGPIVIEGNNSPGYTDLSSISEYYYVKKAYKYAKKSLRENTTKRQ